MLHYSLINSHPDKNSMPFEHSENFFNANLRIILLLFQKKNSSHILIEMMPLITCPFLDAEFRMLGYHSFSSTLNALIHALPHSTTCFMSTGDCAG